MGLLEESVAQSHDPQGFLVRRNEKVGPSHAGGFECALDVIALHPGKGELVYVKASMDAFSWARRDHRTQEKFEVGKRHIPELFSGLELPGKRTGSHPPGTGAVRIYPAMGVGGWSWLMICFAR